MQARFDKEGRPLPDTGHGCGCQICADANAPRHESRQVARSAVLPWAIVRRGLVRLVKKLRSRTRPQAA